MNISINRKFNIADITNITFPLYDWIENIFKSSKYKYYKNGSLDIIYNNCIIIQYDSISSFVFITIDIWKKYCGISNTDDTYGLYDIVSNRLIKHTKIINVPILHHRMGIAKLPIK
jgi:hypothetical protein